MLTNVSKPEHQDGCTCKDCAVFNELNKVDQLLEGHTFEMPEALPPDHEKERLLCICEKQMDCIERYKKDWKTVFGHLQTLASVSSKTGKINLGSILKIAQEALKEDNPLQAAIQEMYEISERNAR